MRADFLQDKCWVCGSDLLADDNFCRICGVRLVRPERHQPGAPAERIDRRKAIGIFMLTLGMVVGILSYFMGIVPMLAFGLATFLLGLMVLFLPESTRNALNGLATDSSLPPLLTIENLLVDLDLDERGIYVPVSGVGNCPKVFVPLSRTSATRRPPMGLNSSKRVFVTVGNNPEDRGVLLDAPGSQILEAIEGTLKMDLMATSPDDMERTMNSAFNALGMGKVTAVERRSDEVSVELEMTALFDLETRLRNMAPRLVAQVGTPMASVAAAAVCKIMGKYVMLKSAVLDASSRKLKVILKLG